MLNEVVVHCCYCLRLSTNIFICLVVLIYHGGDFLFWSMFGINALKESTLISKLDFLN